MRRLTKGDHGAAAAIKKAAAAAAATAAEEGAGAQLSRTQQQQHLRQQQQRWAVRRLIESISLLRNILFERFLTSPMEDEERHQFLREVPLILRGKDRLTVRGADRKEFKLTDKIKRRTE